MRSSGFLAVYRIPSDLSPLPAGPLGSSLHQLATESEIRFDEHPPGLRSAFEASTRARDKLTPVRLS
jgi:hypothetical protein